MAKNPYQHIDLRVNDRQTAIEFYKKLLPAVGFERDEGGKNFYCFSAELETPATAWFGFTEDPDHRPNANRIAFWAQSRKEVDRLAEVAQQAGAKNISGPRACPEYAETYYAVFFEDPFGNCLEVCHL